jgi:hypothetical protein
LIRRLSAELVRMCFSAAKMIVCNSKDFISSRICLIAFKFSMYVLLGTQCKSFCFETTGRTTKRFALCPQQDVHWKFERNQAYSRRYEVLWITNNHFCRRKTHPHQFCW